MQEIQLNDVVVLLPKYGEDGSNGTKLILKEKELYFKKRTQTIIKSIFKEEGYDVLALKKRFERKLGIKNIKVIALDSNNIYIPFKARKALFKNDGTYGYFNLKYYIKHEEKGRSIELHMRNDIVLNCFSKRSYMENKIREARMIQNITEKELNTSGYEKYLREMIEIIKFMSEFKNRYEELEKILFEIQKIKTEEIKHLM